MIRIKKVHIIILLILASTAIYPAVIENSRCAADQGDMKEIRAVIKGAVEDDSWLYAGDADYIEKILGNYYEGQLLKKLSRDAWEFNKKNTDWYSRAVLVSINVKQQDNNQATVMAVIDVEDCTTGGRQRGSAVYHISKESGKWRIFNVSYMWNAEV